MNVSSIKEWTVLSAIKSWSDVYIKFVYVFGRSGDEVIVATNDGRVYAFGKNEYGVLGLGHKRAVKKPTIVKQLCDKEIKLIQSHNDNNGDSSYVLALTRSGQIYSWGSNESGCLGNGSENDCYEPKIIETLNGVRVIDVCGGHQCLALTESGDVYAWGFSKFGTLWSQLEVLIKEVIPIKVMALSDVKIISISCGGLHSMALTDTGVVYGFGNNRNGQLGIGNTINQNIHIKVELSEEIVIKKICCGLNHTLLLSSTGDIYAFGDNNSGQIGDGSKDNKLTPVKIALKTKIADIFASSQHNISLAMTIDNKCFVWGENDWTVPTEVMQNNINDAFNYYVNIKITLKPLQFSNSKPVVYQRLSDSFNDEKYSDIKFLIEGKHIYAQKLYLRSVCKHFDRMFSNEWLENSKNEIPISQYSYSVFHSFIQYLYTNRVEIKAEEAVDLLDLANCYLEEELKNECIEIIKNNISIENICQLFCASLKYKSTQLEDYCLKFASNKVKDILNTEGFDRMDDKSGKTLFYKLFK